MSKESLYEKRIEIPEEVQVTIDGKTIKVSGPKGSLERTFDEPIVTFALEGNEVVASTWIARKKTRALVGTIIAHVRNMIVGVTHGYEYTMKIVFSHFPITVDIHDDKVHIRNFIGERGIRTARLIGDVDVKTTEDEVIISGIDIEHVSQSAANIQLATNIRDKDRRVFMDGIYVIKKRKGEEVKSIV